MRTEELLQQSQTLTQELQSQSQGAHPAAGRAQALQLGAGEAGARAGGEGASCSRSRTRKVEEKNREVEQARASPGGEGRAALAHLQVQERVPRQHVATSCARRSTACSSSPSCSSDNQDGNLSRQAGRVREDHLRVGRRPAHADQRDPRPVQGRGRQDAGRAARRRRWPSSTDFVEPHLPPGRRAEGPGLQHRGGAGRARRRPHRPAAAAAGAQEPAVQRLQVHRARAA